MNYSSIFTMSAVDLKTQSINNYMAEFLKEIDLTFLNPDFDSFFICSFVFIK